MCAFSGHVRVCAGTHVVSSPWDCTTQTYQKSAHRRNPSLCTWNQISITHIYQTDHSNLSHSTLTIKSLITLYLLAWTMECERQYILCFAHVHRVEYIDDCVTFHQKKSLAIYLIYYSESEFIMITNCIFALTHSDSTDIMKYVRPLLVKWLGNEEKMVRNMTQNVYTHLLQLEWQNDVCWPRKGVPCHEYATH